MRFVQLLGWHEQRPRHGAGRVEAACMLEHGLISSGMHVHHDLAHGLLDALAPGHECPQVRGGRQ